VTEKEIIAGVRPFLEADDMEGLRGALEKMHPADIAEILESLEDPERYRVFDVLPPELASKTLSELDEEFQEHLIHRSDAKTIGAIIEEMAPDDAVDILADLPLEAAERILGTIEAAEARELKNLLRYDEESAGGLMTTDVVKVTKDRTVDQAIVEVRRQAKEIEEVYTAFVVDDEGVVKGSVSLQNLILADSDLRVRDVMETDIVYVTTGVDREEVARDMVKYNIVVIPVVDRVGKLLGRITFDDVMDIIEYESTEDMLLFAGTDEEEVITGGPRQAVRYRLPWLYMNLVTAFLAASVVRLFSDTISQKVILAVFMPLVAGMAGSAATQTLAVTIRSIALGEVSPGKGLRLVRKELLIGMLNGVGVGLVVSGIAFFWQRNAHLGLLVGTVMWINTTVASVIGALLPLVLKRLGHDPAIASSSFVTSMTDMVGFFILLGLSTLLLVYI
jgi:magnesium transporter